MARGRDIYLAPDEARSPVSGRQGSRRREASLDAYDRDYYPRSRSRHYSPSYPDADERRYPFAEPQDFSPCSRRSSSREPAQLYPHDPPSSSRSNHSGHSSRGHSSGSSNKYPLQRRSSYTPSSSASSSHSPSQPRSSRSGPGSRGRDPNARYYPPSASRAQPQVRAGKRPSASRSSSSSSQSSYKGGGSNNDKGVLTKAMRTAIEAGAVAALKQRNDPSPWIGMKGTKVAAAALGAAAIDTFMEHKAPKRKGGISHTMMRQATTMALSNLVLGPAVKGTRMGRTAA